MVVLVFTLKQELQHHAALHSNRNVMAPFVESYYTFELLQHDIVFINGAEGVDPFPWGWRGVPCLSEMLRKFAGIWVWRTR